MNTAAKVKPGKSESLNLAARAELLWLGRDLPLWIRLESRALDGDIAASTEDSGYTLQALIDVLSRRRKTASPSSTFEAGPFRLRSPSPAPR